MLEKTEHAVLVGPVVIAMAMIAREHARRRGTDLLGGFELSLGNATFELFEPCPHPLHRLDAVPALESWPPPSLAARDENTTREPVDPGDEKPWQRVILLPPPCRDRVGRPASGRRDLGLGQTCVVREIPEIERGKRRGATDTMAVTLCRITPARPAQRRAS